MATIGGITRSGRIYEPNVVENAPVQEKDGKKKDDEKTKLAKLMKASEFKVVE